MLTIIRPLDHLCVHIVLIIQKLHVYIVNIIYQLF